MSCSRISHSAVKVQGQSLVNSLQEANKLYNGKSDSGVSSRCACFYTHSYLARF